MKKGRNKEKNECRKKRARENRKIVGNRNTKQFYYARAFSFLFAVLFSSSSFCFFSLSPFIRLPEHAPVARSESKIDAESLAFYRFERTLHFVFSYIKFILPTSRGDMCSERRSFERNAATELLFSHFKLAFMVILLSVISF